MLRISESKKIGKPYTSLKRCKYQVQPIIMKIEDLNQLKNCIEKDTEKLETIVENDNREYDADCLGENLELNKILIKIINQKIVKVSGCNSNYFTEMFLKIEEFNRLKEILKIDYD